MGYQGVEVIAGKDDQGVDIVCEKRDGLLKTRVAIQCKCKAVSSWYADCLGAGDGATAVAVGARPFARTECASMPPLLRPS